MSEEVHQTRSKPQDHERSLDLTLSAESARATEASPDSTAIDQNSKPGHGEGLFKALIENATEIITVLNRDFSRRYVSPSVERVLGYQAEELIGKSFFDLLHPDDIPEVIKLCTEGPGYTAARQYRIRHKDGSWRIHEATGHNLLDDPAVAGVVINAHDITERKRAEEEHKALLEREQVARQEAEAASERINSVQRVTDAAFAHLALDEMLTQLLDRIREVLHVDTVAIMLLEPKGDELVAWAAKGLEEEVEAGVHVPLGKGITGRLAAERAPMRVDDLDRAEVVNPLLREKGIRSLLGVPLLVEGRLVGVLHVGTLKPRQFTDDDVQLLQLVADRIALASENARLYEQERSLRREAEAANCAKDVFLSILSHELRTPLTAIIGWIHMMRRGMLKETEFARGFDVIDKNSKMLKRLINDLLDMSAILTGKMRMERKPVKLKAVLLEAIENLRPAAAERDIHLEVSFRDWEDSVTVDGDRTRLIQAFSNLLHNAVKFSAAGGHVRVTGVANRDAAFVRVEDQGLGIAADFLPHVFERFRQADGSDTQGGLGMGLALAKSFVEAHGGTIEAASEGEGRGSAFTIRLPCTPVVAETAVAAYKAT